MTNLLGFGFANVLRLLLCVVCVYVCGVLGTDAKLILKNM